MDKRLYILVLVSCFVFTNACRQCCSSSNCNVCCPSCVNPCCDKGRITDCNVTSTTTTTSTRSPTTRDTEATSSPTRRTTTAIIPTKTPRNGRINITNIIRKEFNLVNTITNQNSMNVNVNINSTNTNIVKNNCTIKTCTTISTTSTSTTSTTTTTPKTSPTTTVTTVKPETTTHRNCCVVIVTCQEINCNPYVNVCGDSCRGQHSSGNLSPCIHDCYKHDYWWRQSCWFGSNYCFSTPVDCSNCNNDFYLNYDTYSQCHGCFYSYY